MGAELSESGRRTRWGSDRAAGQGKRGRRRVPHRQGHDGGPAFLGHRLLLQAGQEQVKELSDVTAGLAQYQLPPHLCSVADRPRVGTVSGDKGSGANPAALGGRREDAFEMASTSVLKIFLNDLRSLGLTMIKNPISQVLCQVLCIQVMTSANIEHLLSASRRKQDIQETQGH